MQVTKVTKVTLFSRKYFWKANQLKSKSQIVSHRQPSLSLCHRHQIKNVTSFPVLSPFCHPL